MAYFTTTFLMWAVGGLRPSWLGVCKPNYPADWTPGYPWRFFTTSVCSASEYVLTNLNCNMLIVNNSDKQRTGQQTFPSGHAATIFASYSWLFLYLNAKWKIFDGNAHAWKLLAFFPFIIAVWVSFSRVNDAKHTQFDVCAGITIGIFLAVIGYRFNFCSLFGPDNHIPMRLTWDAPPPPVRHICDLHPKHVDFYPDHTAPGAMGNQGLPVA